VSALPVIGIVDYGMGNRRSVEKALEHVGAEVILTSDRERLGTAAGLVVPGVGAFPTAMRRLRDLGLDGLIGEAVAQRRPLLGICLGMQLLFERSLELEPTPGLGLLAGEVTPLRTAGLRIPHIGWNEVTIVRSSPLTAGPPGQSRPFYHVHSLAARPQNDEDVVATTTYGERFATIVRRGLVFGVQFHPEKSSADGLMLLESFVEVCRAAGAARPASAALRA
jgi:glutamine amidotransferase